MKKISILFIILCVQALSSIASISMATDDYPMAEKMLTEQEIRSGFQRHIISYPADSYLFSLPLNSVIVLGNGKEFLTNKLRNVFQKTHDIYEPNHGSIIIKIKDIDLFIQKLAEDTSPHLYKDNKFNATCNF